MLSVGKIMAGPAAAAYYLDQVARGREDYYAGEGEEAGRWIGSGAQLLEWSGEVDGDDFVSLLAGAGVRKPRVNGVAGFDLTFRAPKSVSVLWAIASPEVARELRAGHDAAVAEALGYMEREACHGRRGTDGVVQVGGDGFVAAAFIHRASRAGDPLLHTHVVVGNLVRGPDGRWTALDGRHLYRQQKTAGFLYQAVLRRELTERLGLQWESVREGVADVRGVSRAVIEHSSQRRAQILEHMAAHGGRSAASAEIAALETRRAKQDVEFDRLRADWTARAAKHGLTRDSVERLLGPGRLVEVRPTRVPARLDHELTEQASTFGRAEVLQALAAAQPEGARVGELEAVADQVLADPEIVRLPASEARAGVVEPRYTTRELLAVEARLLERARSRRNSHVARVDPWTLRQQLHDHPTLTLEQREVVRVLCGGGDGISVEAWRADNVNVTGCSLSARAALELEDQAGIPSVTVAAAKRDLEQGRGLPRGGVLVVDEAGMVGTRDLALFAQAAEDADAKLVLVGDDRQLPEIQAGGAFHALAEDLDALELTEVRRQREAWDRDALAALRRGDVERWARAYRDHGRITVADNARDARAALVNDWSRAKGEAVMIAARRTDVHDLNDRARQLLKEQGRLGKDEVEVAGRAFAEQDRVVGTRNDRQRGILNGQRGTVSKVDREQQSVTVRLDKGREVTLDSGFLAEGKLDHAYALTAHKAQGATVDRAFVLGSRDLYRELGYTALSRHRDEARFYVARPDVEPKVERDLPQQDPLVDGLGDLLERSGAKRLAHDSLSDRDTKDLEKERDQLRKALKDKEPPSVREADERARAREHARKTLDATERRIGRLHDERKGIGFFDFGERRRVDAYLGLARDARERELEQRDFTAAAHERTVAHARNWLTRFGDQAARLVAASREVAERRLIEKRAVERIQAVERAPKLMERELPRPEIAPELDRGFGLDLD